MHMECQIRLVANGFGDGYKNKWSGGEEIFGFTGVITDLYLKPRKNYIFFSYWLSTLGRRKEI